MGITDSLKRNSFFSPELSLFFNIIYETFDSAVLSWHIHKNEKVEMAVREWCKWRSPNFAATVLVNSLQNRKNFIIVLRNYAEKIIIPEWSKLSVFDVLMASPFNFVT